jgi:hypothetical protein
VQRRKYVATLGAALTTGLAGCGGNDSPPNDGAEDTPTGTPGSGTDSPRSDSEEWYSTYREALESNDIDVEFADVAGERMVVDYNTHTTNQEALVDEVRVVAETYAKVLEPDWELETAELWVLDPEIDDPQREAIMSYLVESQWARAWRDDELSDEAFMNNILDTVESYA